MSELWKLIEDYEREFGAKPSWVAKQMRTKEQTLYNWRVRGIKALPNDQLLRALAWALRKSHNEVLFAALVDIGRISPGQRDALLEQLPASELEPETEPEWTATGT